MPSDAFEQFVALGSGRSYAKLAEALGCSKRSVTAKATKEGWQRRLAAIEAEARLKTDEKLADSAAAVNERQLRMVRAMQGKALQALQALPLGSGMDAIRALDLSIKAERVILGVNGTGNLMVEDFLAGGGPRGKQRVEMPRERIQINVITGIEHSPEDGAWQRALPGQAEVRVIGEPGLPPSE